MQFTRSKRHETATRFPSDVALLKHSAVLALIVFLQLREGERERNPHFSCLKEDIDAKAVSILTKLLVENISTIVLVIV